MDVNLEHLEKVYDALVNSDLLATIDEQTWTSRSSIEFPYVKCDTSSLIVRVCFGYEIIMGTYSHPSEASFVDYRSRIMKHVDKKDRAQDIDAYFMGNSFRSEFFHMYHYFNYDPSNKQFIDFTYGQYDPQVRIYTNSNPPPHLSAISNVKKTYREEWQPQVREIIRNICSDRWLIWK